MKLCVCEKKIIGANVAIWKNIVYGTVAKKKKTDITLQTKYRNNAKKYLRYA